MATKKCGDCIHAEICKQVNSGWFSPKNIAYCKGFKCSANFVEVVRCKDCKHMNITGIGFRWCQAWERIQTMGDDGFCCFGERKDNDST